MKRRAFGVFGAFFWATVLGLIVVRYVDISKLHGPLVRCWRVAAGNLVSQRGKVDTDSSDEPLAAVLLLREGVRRCTQDMALQPG